ncbi:hypothetical protein P9112_005907 [Eukaryota sp. TZLM1-RC]
MHFPSLQMNLSAEALSAFNCSCCLGLLKSPVSLSCGHSFCKSCIESWCKDHKNCPSCRASVEHASFNVNVVMMNILDQMLKGTAIDPSKLTDVKLIKCLSDCNVLAARFNESPVLWFQYRREGNDSLVSIANDHFNLFQSLGTSDNLPQVHGITHNPAGIVTQKLDAFASEILDDLSNGSKLKLLKEAAKSLNSLHSNDLIHGHIHPDNVLVDINNEGVKLACLSPVHYKPADSPVEKNVVLNVPFIAPEIITGKTTKTTKSADVYALGLFFCRVLIGKDFINEGYFELLSKMIENNGLAPVNYDQLPKKVTDLVKRMLQQDPGTRPSSSTLLEELNDLPSLQPDSDGNDDDNSGISSSVLLALFRDLIGGGNSDDSDDEGDLDFKQAITAAKLGNAKAMFNVGQSYRLGDDGVQQSHEKSLHWYLKAGENGCPAGYHQAGLCYLRGLGTRQDEKKAVELFLKAANHEERLSHPAYLLGVCYEQGRGVPKDDRQRFHWYNEAAARGDMDAEMEKGICLKHGIGCDQDNSAAYTCFVNASNAGIARPLYFLGIMAATGQGCDQDYPAAFNYFKTAAEKGVTDAYYNLAVYYELGRGTEKNDQQRFYWYKKSGEAGEPKGICETAICYMTGAGVGRDYNEGFRLFQQAHDMGNRSATVKLGHAYEEGHGCRKNNEKAFEMYKMAAEAEVTEGMIHLARCYGKGIGTKKDKKKENQWLLKVSGKL